MIPMCFIFYAKQNRPSEIPPTDHLPNDLYYMSTLNFNIVHVLVKLGSLIFRLMMPKKWR